MKRLRSALLLILFYNFILINGLAISPKLDFPEKSGVVEVKRDLKGGKIKGLRVTVDTSELKGVKNKSKSVKIPAIILHNFFFIFLRIKK